MPFISEGQLENHLRHLIDTRITTRFPNIYALDNKKAVDIVICRDGEKSALFFLEVKLYQQSHNRLGIGAGGGNGYQPEIIVRHPDYFETNLRWIIADGRETTNKYLFIATSVLGQYLSGSQAGDKQNNIQLKIFKEIEALDEDTFISELTKWLQGKSEPPEQKTAAAASQTVELPG